MARKRNMDEDLRELERRATVGDAGDVLAFVVALERAGALAPDKHDLRPSMQQKVLDALAADAESNSAESIERYLKALEAFGYPIGMGAALHGSDLTAAVAVALRGREVDPEAIYHVMSREDTWDGAIGPMLDELENECAAVARDLARERERARRPVLRRTLNAQRREVADRTYEEIRRDTYWSSVNIESETPWRRSGDTYRRVVWVSDGMGWSDSINVVVSFEPDSTTVASSDATSEMNGESIFDAE